MCGFSTSKPVLMVIGGSLGAASINQAVREALPHLLKDFQVVHICGRDKIDNLLLNTKGYKQFEYLKTELKDVFAMADVVVSRAGANAICELLALRKPNLLIPSPQEAAGIRFSMPNPLNHRDTVLLLTKTISLLTFFVKRFRNCISQDRLTLMPWQKVSRQMQLHPLPV